MLPQILRSHLSFVSNRLCDRMGIGMQDIKIRRGLKSKRLRIVYSIIAFASGLQILLTSRISTLSWERRVVKSCTGRKQLSGSR